MPEIVDSWETGLKADWLDRRLRTNVAFFYNKFDGFQSTLVQIVNGASVSNFVNAGKAKIYGSEWEITAIPVENLELRGGVGTLYAKMTEVSQGGLGILPGNHLPNAPAFNANGSARYTFPLGDAGKLSLQGEFTNTSRSGWLKGSDRTSTASTTLQIAPVNHIHNNASVRQRAE